ncbi:MAG TPA: sensor histidine kinase [Streptosporangiaceae bacterium]|nr:sensor histidine kinase [Streptosporangiaceae bacterium]
MSFWAPVENPGTRPWRSWVFDVGCALLAAATSFGSFSFAQAAHPALPTLAVSLVVAVLTALVLSLRRVWPGPVFAVTVLMAAVLAQWPVRGALFPFPSAIALYTVAVTLSRTAAFVAAAFAVAAELPAAGQGGWHNGWLPAIYEVIGFASVLVAGLYVSTRRAYLAELRDRTQRLEREHDQTSALAAAVERARIAREMHDSVAHHLTVIVALSDGALAAVTRSPAQASEAIRGVSSTAREALAETRRLLGILRAEDGLELRQPLPGLSDLEALFTRVRAAGLPVRYERSGPPGDTPPGVQLVVFRLVQEALTNTMKHAGPGASAAVRLWLAPGEVRVEVEDDGIGNAGVPGTPGGGLTGMRERVGAFGGELTCGPRQPNGWQVTARLDPGTVDPGTVDPAPVVPDPAVTP